MVRLSKYTTEVRFICETEAGLTDSVGYSSIDSVLNKAIPKVFDFDYPIFDKKYKNVLERKILKHYYTREICCETVGLWKHFLSVRMNEIMPYYNKLYESELLNFNPFYDVDYTKSHEGEGTTNGNETTTNTEKVTNTDTITGRKDGSFAEQEGGTIKDNGTKNGTEKNTGDTISKDSGSDKTTKQSAPHNVRWDIYSDTPQGSLQNVANEQYLTNARKITDDGTGSTETETVTYGKTNTQTDNKTKTTNETDNNTRTLNTSKTGNSYENNTQTDNGTRNTTGNGNKTTKINTTDDYLEHVKGKMSGSSYAKLLQEYRETFLNIDVMIINELKDLFFNLW